MRTGDQRDRRRCKLKKSGRSWLIQKSDRVGPIGGFLRANDSTQKITEQTETRDGVGGKESECQEGTAEASSKKHMGKSNGRSNAASDRDFSSLGRNATLLPGFSGLPTAVLRFISIMTAAAHKTGVAPAGQLPRTWLCRALAPHCHRSSSSKLPSPRGSRLVFSWKGFDASRRPPHNPPASPQAKTKRGRRIVGVSRRCDIFRSSLSGLQLVSTLFFFFFFSTPVLVFPLLFLLAQGANLQSPVGSPWSAVSSSFNRRQILKC